MARKTFTREDIESLCDKLDARMWSNLFIDMPETRMEVRSATALLRFYLSIGMPPESITVDIFNGII